MFYTVSAKTTNSDAFTGKGCQNFTVTLLILWYKLLNIINHSEMMLVLLILWVKVGVLFHVSDIVLLYN